MKEVRVVTTWGLGLGLVLRIQGVVVGFRV